MATVLRNFDFGGPLASKDPQRLKIEAEQLCRIATALAKSVSVSEMAHLVMVECKAALGADALGVQLLQNDGYYHLVAETGGIKEFREQCKRMAPGCYPILKSDNLHDTIFLGTPEEFSKEMPGYVEIYNKGNRHTLGQAPLAVNQKPIGMLSFCYSNEPRIPSQRTYLLTLLSFCAQALDRINLFEQEKEARKEAEAANRAKSDFLSNVSHEIRTPLGVIQGYADLLVESKNLSEKEREFAAIMQRNTRQLANIIGEVLDISKIEAEKLEIENAEFSLHELIGDVKTIAIFKGKERGISIDFKYDITAIPKFIYSDATRIRQVLINLISNAIKFTLRGRIEVQFELLHKSELSVTVKDHGIGIAPENRARIFEPFVQADSSTTRRFGGTGLGLSIAKNLAKALGGDVELVETEVNRGSTFRFCFPVTPIKVSSKETEDMSDDKESKLALQGRKVLLVDDSEDIQDLVQFVLTEHGVNVKVAESGNDGFELARSDDFDMILMDIQMPDLDGYQTTALIRNHGYRRPIVALTAHAMRSEKEKALRSGFTDYLTKPIDFHKLMNVIERLSS